MHNMTYFSGPYYATTEPENSLFLKIKITDTLFEGLKFGLYFGNQWRQITDNKF